MTTCRRIPRFMLAAIVLAVPVRGQEAAPPPLAPQYVDAQAGVTLDTAITRALEREPSLRAVRADIAIAQGMRQQAGLRPNPTLTFERRTEPGGTDSLSSVGIQWPLDLFRRDGRVQTTERELQATQLGVTDRERLLAADVRMQYGVAAAAVREAVIADEVVAAAQRQWDIVRARAETGATPPLDRDLLEVELRRFEAERLLATGRADAAMVQLRQLLGMSPEEPLRLRETLESLVTARTIAAWLESSVSISARPDVREAEARVAVSDARIDQARREGRVDVSLFGTYMRMDAGFPQQGFGPTGALERVRGRFNYVSGGAMVMVPLFNRNQGQIAAAQAERTGAEARPRSGGTGRTRGGRRGAGARCAGAASGHPLLRQGADTRSTKPRRRPADVRSRSRHGLRRSDGTAPVSRYRARVHHRITRGLGGTCRSQARTGRNEMNSESRVSVRWAVLIAAALALMAVGAGATYIGLRSRALSESDEQAPMAATPSPAARPAAEPTSGGVESAALPDVVVTLSKEAVDRAGMTVTAVAAGTMSGGLRAPGVVEPNAYKQVVVTPVVSGRITRVAAELGQHVQRGQTLAQIFSPELADAQTRYISARGGAGGA